MILSQASSPHAKGRMNVSQVMFTVSAATLPGLACLIWFFGWGYLFNVLTAIIFALITETLVMIIRKRPILFYLKDGSAFLTALLLGLALPPFAPWWIAAVGSVFSILFVKHLYGGLGNNPFNPAMAGYALLLISFPVQMTTAWGAPSVMPGHSLPGFFETLQMYLGFAEVVDGYTMATPLDVYKLNIAVQTQAELAMKSEFLAGWLPGWLWVSIAYAIGGVFLIWRGIITWHTPVAVLASLLIMSGLFSWDADIRVPVYLHMLGGATMIGAFFIATDPVSSATSNRGKLIYGAGIGVLTYVIRTFGNYPDAIAFAVLLMNFCAPLIDHYSRPKIYGHEKSVRGYKKEDKA